jgi:glycosyltransferase involved in cell wall biosynthesis
VKIVTHRETIDILMITYNRPEYTRLALERLLDTCDETMRVWLWHNGTHSETLEVVGSLAEHPRVHAFRHSQENRKLRDPTNWLFENAKGDYISKVDDDCLVPYGWADTLRSVHARNPQLGAVACWLYPEEDFRFELAKKKIRTFAGGDRMMLNCWVQGSGYLMKRRCVEEQGPLRKGQSFPRYCIQLALNGWLNGWYYPFLFQEHMDDPRSQHCRIQTDEDLRCFAPLTAQRWGVSTLAEYRTRFREEAVALQGAPTDPRQFVGWRLKLRRTTERVRNLLSGRRGFRLAR